MAESNENPPAYPTISRRERKKRETRRRILEAALELMTDRAYADVKIEEISAAADVANATFFLHFPTKASLITAFNDEVAAKIADTCTTAFHALWLHDYGRVDLRLTHDAAIYVLEVNPNPFLAQENEMADAAEKAGMTYNAFIQRIVDEALARGPA